MDASSAWEPLTIAEAQALLIAAPCRWWISGGLALELHVGEAWRPHHDLDIGIVRADAPHVAATMPGWTFAVARAGTLRPWYGEPLGPADGNNVWCRIGDGPWRIDLTIGDGDTERWTYRRDPRVQRPWSTAVLSDGRGVPYLAPDLQLLYKSKDHRPKDDVDAAIVIPRLRPDERAFLRAHLPDSHSWRALLDAGDDLESR